MPAERRVVIIGGGVIGLCTAYYCALRGHHVTLIERQPANRDGCSYGNAGMIVPSHFTPLAAPGMAALALKWMCDPGSPFYIKPRLSWPLVDWAFKFWRASTHAHVRRAAPLLRDMSLASRACFEELAALPPGDFGLVKNGLLMLCKTQRTLDEEAHTATMAGQLGIPAEVHDAKGAAALDPTVTMDVAGAIYFPKDCHLTPRRFLESIQDRLAKMNVDFVWDSAVAGWSIDNDRLIRAARLRTGHEIHGDEFILCGGSWSPATARDLSLKIPMQAGKGYSLTMPQPRELPRLCSILTEARVAVTPMGNALRFGGTMEIAGMDESINPRRVKGIINAVPKYFPEFEAPDFAGIKPWCGLRPCSPDGLPYLGRTARHRNLIVATGHAMMGLSLGPVTGRTVADLISGEKPPFDLTQLSPDRFN